MVAGGTNEAPGWYAWTARDLAWPVMCCAGVPAPTGGAGKMAAPAGLIFIATFQSIAFCVKLVDPFYTPQSFHIVRMESLNK